MKPLFFCLLTVAILLVVYISFCNQLSQMQMEIPQIGRVVKRLEEDNNRLQYEIECFENSLHLLELLRQPEYSHLKMPYRNEVIDER